MPIVFGSSEATAIRNRDRKLTDAQAEAAKPIPEHERRAYIARAECGCVCGICTDDPHNPKRTAANVAKFIRGGLKVENISWARYQEIKQEPTFFIIDSYTVEGELIHVYRTPNGEHYSGPADVRKHVAAYQLVTVIA